MSEVKFLNDCFQRVTKAKERISKELLERIKKLELGNDKYKGQAEKLLDKCVKLDANLRMAVKEKDRLKMKVIRLSNLKR